MTADRTQFGKDTVTDEVLEGIDLTGKTALVTGGASGIGTETARALASKGAKVIIAARKTSDGDKAVEAIRAAVKGADISVEQLDLASFSSVRAFADRVLKTNDKLDLLINNAGVMACPFSKTADGFEMQFGTNHLGHFLMTNLIMPALIKGDHARIISLSSLGHHMSPVVFDDINFEKREYNSWASYGQSKTANILFAVELEKRFGDQGVHAFAVHPGAIQTNLGRHLTEKDYEFLRRPRADGSSMSFKSIPAGAATSVYAATAPELEGMGGLYLEDCGIADLIADPASSVGVRPYAIDSENAAKLWAISEDMTGQKFP